MTAPPHLPTAEGCCAGYPAYGGALHVEGGSSSTYSWSSCTFTNTTASSSGGACLKLCGLMLCGGGVVCAVLLCNPHCLWVSVLPSGFLPQYHWS